MNCSHCGQLISPEANYCPACGTRVSTHIESEQPTAIVPDLPTRQPEEAPPSPGTIDQPHATKNARPLETFLRHEFPSTWLAVVLQIITFGIWPVHYMKQLTEWLDEAQGGHPNDSTSPWISVEFIAANFVFAYGNAVASLLSLSDAENLAYFVFSSIIGLIAFVLHVLWAFKVRTQLHHLWRWDFQTSGLLSGFLTFLLQYLYLNYKILQMKARSDTTPIT